MTRSLPLAIETSQAVPIEELSRNLGVASLATDPSNTWDQQPVEVAQSDDLDKLEQEIHQNSILLNKLHQIDVAKNYADEDTMRNKNRIQTDLQSEIEDDLNTSLEAIKLTQWRTTITRTFAEGQFDIVLGIISAVLMFILILLLFIFKCRSRFAEQNQLDDKEERIDAEQGVLHRPEEVLRVSCPMQQQTMHV